ncbi:helix-turn-helix transcriptional regulator (plasmid) [Paenibacillus cellulosilyticus]|nr:helix-turn-helix transcriptional regulator [Paenibacillus cellulosilyticus]
MIALRDSNNLTQEQLAEAVGLSQSMIAHIEAGRKEPSKKFKISIAKHFNVSVEWLFYEEINDQKSLFYVS